MKRTLLGLGILAVLGGCAHSAMRGSVAMKASDDELHVCLGDNEVKPGDRVAFFQNKCTGVGGKELAGRRCTKERLGEGQVTKTLNEHYSVVRPMAGLKVEEGAIVEKL